MVLPTTNDERLTTDLPDFIQQFLKIGHLIEGIDLGPCDSALLIDNERSTFADSGHRWRISHDSELLRDRRVRIKIGRHRNLHGANVFLLPRNVAGYGIYTDVQNLGIQIRELA